MRMMDNGETAIYSGKYIGKTMCGFVHGESYAVKIIKDLYGYTVEELDEVVESADIACMRYASVKSIEQNWELE